MRFLANPHYEPELREMTGLDQAVVDYIARDGRLEQLYERLFALLDFLLPQYVAEGKAHLVIAIGSAAGATVRSRSPSTWQRATGARTTSTWRSPTGTSSPAAVEPEAVR